MREATADTLAQAADWADRLPDLDAAGRRSLKAWLDEAPAHAAAFDAMLRLLNDPALLDAAAAAAPAESRPAPLPLARPARPRWRRSAREIGRGTGRRSAGLAAAIAAAVVIAVAVPASLRWAGPAVPVVARQVYASEAGQRRDVALPDGSTMTLDAASRVAIAFADDARGLDLMRGAARFEVRHDADRPFTVATHDARMTALGTDFSVDAGGGVTELRVFRGRVRLAVAGYAPVVVVAGQWASVAGRTPHLRRFDPARYRGWQQNWLEGDAIPLRIAIVRIGRYTPIPIRLADPQLGDEIVSGRFRLDMPSDSLRQIAALFDLALVEREDGWYLKRRASHDNIRGNSVKR